MAIVRSIRILLHVGYRKGKFCRDEFSEAEISILLRFAEEAKSCTSVNAKKCSLQMDGEMVSLHVDQSWGIKRQ
jgi:hypothetical protein